VLHSTLPSSRVAEANRSFNVLHERGQKVAEEKPNGQEIKLLVAEANQDSRALIIRLLTLGGGIRVVAEASNGQEALDLAKITRPDVVLAAIELPVIDGLELTGLLTHTLGCAVILMSTASDNQILREGMRVGARDFLVKPLSDGELHAAIIRAHKSQQKIAQQSYPALADTKSKGQLRSRVIVTFSAKGGVGKSVIAANLGVLLSQRGIKTVLVDGDIGYGGLHYHLGIPKGGRNIVTLFSTDPPWQPGEVRDNLTRHKESGLWFLPSPGHPVHIDNFHAEHYRKMVEQLREEFPVIIIDLPTLLSDPLLSVLLLADDILMVTTQDMVSLQNTFQMVALLASESALGLPLDIFRLVYNQGEPAIMEDLSAEQLKEYADQKLKIPLVGVLPIEPGVPLSIAKASVLTSWSPASRWSKAIKNLAENLLGQPMPQPEVKKGLMATFRDILLGNRTSLGGTE